MPSRPVLRHQPQAVTRLPHAIRKVMEGFFDEDLSDVRIHVGAQPAALGVQAFARGSDIHFAPGAYDLASAAGRRVLGHELTHVIQQRAGRVRPSMVRPDRSLGAGALRASLPGHRGAWLVCDPLLEAEADHLGALAAARLEAELGPGPYPPGEQAAPRRPSPEASVLQPLVITVANQNGGNPMNNQALKTFIDNNTQGTTANAGQCANSIENHNGYTSGGGTNVALTGVNTTVFHVSHGAMGQNNSVTVFFYRTGGNAASAQNPGTVVAIGYHSASRRGSHTYEIEWYVNGVWPNAYRNRVTI